MFANGGLQEEPVLPPRGKNALACEGGEVGFALQVGVRVDPVGAELLNLPCVQYALPCASRCWPTPKALQMFVFRS